MTVHIYRPVRPDEITRPHPPAGPRFCESCNETTYHEPAGARRFICRRCHVNTEITEQESDARREMQEEDYRRD